jgi:hypothetical protein
MPEERKHNKQILLLGLVLVWVLLGNVNLSSAAPQYTPLPSTTEITPPSPELPKEIAGFSGTWYGVWDAGVKTTLVVEKIESSTAIAVYSWGEYKGKEGYWGRYEWKIEPGKLETSSEDGKLTISYFLSEDGRVLKGRLVRKGTQTVILYVTMQRDIPASLPISTVSSSTPLPLTTEITPPSPELPKEIAGFSGTWYGVWDNGRKTTLIVEIIEPPTAIAVYSWGEYKGKEGDWRRHEWKIEPGKLELESTDRLAITFVLLPNGELEGIWKKGREKHNVTMRRQ